MQKFRLLICLLLIVVICANPLDPTVMAASTPTISVSDGTVQHGSQIEAEFNIALSGNPGISSMKLTIYYEADALEVSAAAFSSAALATKAQTIINTSIPGMIVLNFLLISGETKLNGDFASVRIKAKEGTPCGSYALELSYDQADVYNEQYDDVVFTLKDGTVSVCHTPVWHEATQPTCTTDGSSEYWSCSGCSLLFSDESCETEINTVPLLAALGHDWGDWTVIKPSTEKEDGEEVRVCKNDGSHQETRVLPKQGGEETLAPTPSEVPAPDQQKDVPFTDVKASDWFVEAVQFVWNKGLMKGVSDSSFAPNMTMNRAMLVTILYRMDGEKKAGEESFADVKASAYYSKAVAWASENGIVFGYDDGMFYPQLTVTREQMVTILWRYISYMGKQLGGDAKLSEYQDEKEISKYAREPMAWAVGIGLLQGTGAHRLEPKSYTTRAQTATMIMRMMSLVF